MKLQIEPVQQVRPRARRIKNGISMYDPKKVKDYKTLVGKIAGKNYADEPLKGDLIVDLTFALAIQKSISKSERLKRVSNENRPHMRPDVELH